MGRKPAKSERTPPPPGAAAARDPVVAALALAGLVVATYLTGVRVFGAPPLFCEAGSGCDAVQASRYATFLGLPTAFWGVLFYLGVLWLAVGPLDARRWYRLFLLAAVGAAFSAYLTVLELAVIRAICGWCIASTLVSWALLAAVWYRRPAPSPRGPAVPATRALARTAGVTAAVVVAAAWLLFDVDIGRPATAFQSGLARHLASTGAVMYGAYW